MLAPNITATFSAEHDAAVAACLTRFLDTAPMPATSLALSHLPLSQGGFGLASATVLAPSAYWASWADAIPVLQQQAPEAFAQLLHQLQTDDPRVSGPTRGYPPPRLRLAAARMATYCKRVGAPRHHRSLEDGIALGRGWQHKAATTTHTAFRAEVRQRLAPWSQALLESQTGSHASQAFTTMPYHNDNSYPSHLFRLLLLRRLRLPLPLSARFCRYRRTLDSLGGPRAACAQSGLLRAFGGVLLARAVARICREAGARVTTNTRLVDLNLEHIDRQDDRRPRQRGGETLQTGGFRAGSGRQVE